MKTLCARNPEGIQNWSFDTGIAPCHSQACEGFSYFPRKMLILFVWTNCQLFQSNSTSQNFWHFWYIATATLPLNDTSINNSFILYVVLKLLHLEYILSPSSKSYVPTCPRFLDVFFRGEDPTRDRSGGKIIPFQKLWRIYQNVLNCDKIYICREWLGIVDSRW